MRLFSAVNQLLYLSSLWAVDTHPTTQSPLVYTLGANRNITSKLFAELEELARIVDISYCVGTTGIHKPFLCASRCQDFPGFELVTVSGFNQRPCSRNMAVLVEKLMSPDLEHRSSSRRLLRLCCPLSFTVTSPNHTRVPRNLLDSQHHHRPFHHTAGVSALSNGWRRRRQVYKLHGPWRFPSFVEALAAAP